MKALLGITCGTVLVCGFAVVQASARETKRAVLQVTVRATVSKNWNTVTETMQGDCPASVHSTGRRKVVLRSARLTRVVVRLTRGRASFSPAAVRFVRIEVSASGEQTIHIKAPCEERTEHVLCRPLESVQTGGTLRFFRSARNELSFRRARLPEIGDSCPRQSAAVRAIRPGLHGAEGEFSEAALVNPRIPAQTAIADAEVTNDLDGAEVGRVSERVHWTLTFAQR
jgi:hypothetical protein